MKKAINQGIKQCRNDKRNNTGFDSEPRAFEECLEKRGAMMNHFLMGHQRANDNTDSDNESEHHKQIVHSASIAQGVPHG